MRYLVALLVAGFVIGCATLYVRQVKFSFEERIRADLRQAQKAGKLPPDIDPETTSISDMGMEVSESDMLRLSIADFLVGFRVGLIPMVIIACLAVARFLSPQSSPQ